ncbi:hypothetical protein PFISCL1PPCAC_26917, partial [Pristionchus fissidentatus]
SSSHADFALYHVHHFLNYSVAPCDNFYRHVCSIGMPANETVAVKSEQFYRDLARKQHSRTLNNPIINDIAEARLDLNCTIDPGVYSSLVRERCDTRFDCYFEEFIYFFNIYSRGNDNVDDSLLFYSKHGNKTYRNIPQAIRATAGMIEAMIED